MTSHFRWICCTAILLTASLGLAANVVPGLEVVATKGSSVVFRGVTDARGRFETGPLEPGVYTIEVRTVPNMPPSSARFFLALAGAKPVGEATIRPGVALAMNAVVRHARGIRGQISARGGIVYVQPSVLAANRIPISTPLATAVNPPAAPARAQVAKPAITNRPVAINPPVTPPRTQSNARPVPPPPVTLARTQINARAIPTPSPAANAASPESVVVRRPVGHQPKIINGRRYFWTPIAPGSNLGRWLPEAVAHPVPTASPNSKPTPALTSPTPSRTHR